MKDKFIKKYMLIAKLLSEHEIPCLSRGIGSVIVKPEENRIVSTGYNGPAKNIPHADTYEFLKEYVYPQLTEEDKGILLSKSYFGKTHDVYDAGKFATRFEGCKICPRKLIGAKSGERLELCGCLHSEENSILNAVESLIGCYLFCWCGVPCSYVCSPMIVQKGIKKVYCLSTEEQPGYQPFKSRWLFKKAGVELIELDKNWVLSDE